MNPTTADAAALWRRIVDADTALHVELRNLFAPGVDRLSLLGAGLRKPGADRMTALTIVERLPISERQQLFDTLVFLASFSSGLVQCVRDIILSLPRDWVLARIEQAAEPLLSDGTYDEYRRFLELYELLDRGLTLKLARRAAAQSDPDIREAGQDYLEKLAPERGAANHAGDGQPTPKDAVA